MSFQWGDGCRDGQKRVGGVWLVIIDAMSCDVVE